MQKNVLLFPNAFQFIRSRKNYAIFQRENSSQYKFNRQINKHFRSSAFALSWPINVFAHVFNCLVKWQRHFLKNLESKQHYQWDNCYDNVVINWLNHVDENKPTKVVDVMDSKLKTNCHDLIRKNTNTFISQLIKCAKNARRNAFHWAVIC